MMLFLQNPKSFEQRKNSNTKIYRYQENIYKLPREIYSNLYEDDDFVSDTIELVDLTKVCM